VSDECIKQAKKQTDLQAQNRDTHRDRTWHNGII